MISAYWVNPEEPASVTSRQTIPVGDNYEYTEMYGVGAVSYNSTVGITTHIGILWNIPLPTVGIMPLRMSRRNDSYGFTEPHARFQQNRNASSASTTGQRIYGLGKNAHDPPDPAPTLPQ